MITGYNTDVRHGGLVLHVQTEDKGLANPQIESLVYVGGRVVAAKRISYAERLREHGRGDASVADLMARQHRAVIDAIRSGQLDSRLGLEKAPGADGGGEGVAPPAEPEAVPEAAGVAPGVAPAVAEPAGEPALPLDEPFDELVLDYLSGRSGRDRMVLELRSQEELALGASSRVSFRVTCGDRPVSGADLEVKLISTVAPPAPLARGRTGDDGVLAMELSVPELDRGTAALIISATAAEGEAEIKYLL